MSSSGSVPAGVVTNSTVVNPEALPALSAEELHKIVLRCRGHENRARYVLICALHTLSESKRYLELGFPSIVAYAQKFLGYRRSSTFEAIRVAKALEYLPHSKEKYLAGSLSWTALRQISRVAATDTEDTWLKFADEHNPDRLRAEVEDAVKKNRSVPRAKGYGLPNLEATLKVSFSLSELEIVQKGLEVIAQELSTRLAGEAVSLKDVLLFVAERALATASGDPMEGRPTRLDPHYNVVYHVCTGCHRSQMATASGMVEVPPDVVARVEADAHQESIHPEDEVPGEEPRDGTPQGDHTSESGDDSPPVDRPNSASLSRKVRLRDGLLCANPHCCRAARQGHHVKFRSQGGATALHNEVAVCEICHVLIHQGRLRVTGSPATGCEWSPQSDGIQIDLEQEKEEIARLPVIEVARTQVKSSETSRSESTAVDPTERDLAVDEAMKQFDYLPDHLPPKAKQARRERLEAQKLVRDAIGVLVDHGVELSEENIVREVLYPNGGRPRAYHRRISPDTVEALSGRG